MANSYCENKSKKPVITRYDPSKNYMVQMVESLASIDYPNENHIYVIESTGEKYIFYNGAFSEFECSGEDPYFIGYEADFTGATFNGVYALKNTTASFTKSYQNVIGAIQDGKPIYVQSEEGEPKQAEIQVFEEFIDFSWKNASVENGYTYIEIYDLKMPTSGDGTATYVKVLINSLYPDSSLSSTSIKPVQNRVLKRYIDNIESSLIPFISIEGTRTDMTDYGVIVSQNLTKNDSLVHWRWGNEEGISPLVRVKYNNGTDDKDRLLMQIGDMLWDINFGDGDYMPYEVALDFAEITIETIQALTLSANKMSTFYVDSQHFQINIYDRESGTNNIVTEFKNRVSGKFLHVNNVAKNYIVIPVNGDQFCLANSANANYTIPIGDTVATYRLL